MLPSGAYPLAWVDNSYYADDDTLKKAKDALVTPKKIVLLVSFIVGVGFGALLMLIAVSIFIIQRVRKVSWVTVVVYINNILNK